jgi:hypothetical protein
MLVLLNIQGTCACLRAKTVNVSGHLPVARRRCHMDHSKKKPPQSFEALSFPVEEVSAASDPSLVMSEDLPFHSVYVTLLA